MSNPFDPREPKVPLSAIAALQGSPRQPNEGLFLAALRQANERSLAGILSNALNPPPPSPTPERPFAGLFGNSPPPLGSGSNYLGALNIPPPPPPQPSALASATAPKPRNVFYSFHYEDDIFRVNHVRKGFQFRTGDKVRDRSLWEKVRRTNPVNLARVINAGLNGTSVTCVLAGAETWSREWVRYEIARSLFCNKGLLTVFVDGCECLRRGFGGRGHNPLDFIALGWDHRIYERVGDTWYLYDKIATKVQVWPKWLTKPGSGCLVPLSAGARAYDWIDDNGGRFLIRWCNQAAIAAGR